MCLVGYLRFETGDQIVEHIAVFGHYGCIVFLITVGICGFILVADM